MIKATQNLLKGKKTYISAAVLLLVAVLGWWFGAVNSTEATGMVAAAFGLAGLGARSTRYAEMTFAALAEIKKDSASGKQIDAAEVARAVRNSFFSGGFVNDPPAAQPAVGGSGSVLEPNSSTNNFSFTLWPIDADAKRRLAAEISPRVAANIAGSVKSSNKEGK